MEKYLQIEKTEITIGLKREYRFFQISDAHITAMNENSSEDDMIEYTRSRNQWHKMKKDFATQFGEFCDERYDGDPSIPFEKLMKYANEQNYDAIIWSGDIIDRVTKSNVDYISCVKKENKIPIIYCLGNHESMDIDGKYKKLYEKLYSVIKNPACDKYEFEEFTVVTFDNGTKNITDEQINFLKNQFLKNEKILVVLHAPLRIGAFGERAIKEFGSYFVMGTDNDSENVHKFIGTIEQNIDKVICILAGHVHTNFDAEIGNGVKQITTSSTLIGMGREIIIKWGKRHAFNTWSKKI